MEDYPAVRVEKLTKTFPPQIRAVKGIDFQAEQNTILGLLGSNGSGKTTTLRMLATVLKPTSGKIDILDLDHEVKKIRQIIGYIPQQDLIYQDLTVQENAQLIADTFRISRKESKNRISSVFEKLGLENYSHRLAGSLSGGYKKRLSIAMAILHRPKVIIADEITVGLDPDLRHKIWNLLRDLRKESTIILTTHYLEEAEKLCDQIILMNLGEIILQGNPHEIIRNHQAKTLEEVFYQEIIQKHDHL